MIPIVYWDIDSYSVLRLIVYRGTCLTCVSWPTSLTWRAWGTYSWRTWLTFVPKAGQVTEVGQDTDAIQDTQVRQVPQARQVSEVGQDSQATQDTQVRQVPRYTIKTRYTIRIYISVLARLAGQG